MAYSSPKSSFLRNILFKCLRFFAVALLYLWVGKALYLWVGGHHYSSYGGFARFFLAFRDSFFSLPDMVLFVLVYGVQLVSALHHTLISQLGYDPFSISVATSQNTGSSEGFALEFGSLPDQAVYGAIFLTFTLSLAQFAGLFLINAMGVPIGWRFVCLPRLLDTRAHVVFSVGTFAAATWLALSAFDVAVAAGITAGLVSALLLWWPLPAGFALWLLMLFGLRPRSLMLLLLSFARFFERRASETSDREDQTTPNDKSSQDKTAEEAERDSGGSNVPETSNMGERLSSACGTFSMPVEEFRSPDFQRQTLVSRFRELAKKFHPDARGSERLMAILNEDYEFLLHYKEWTR